MYINPEGSWNEKGHLGIVHHNYNMQQGIENYLVGTFKFQTLDRYY